MSMTSLSSDTVRRIEDATTALIAAGTANPTNEQVRQHLGGGSQSLIAAGTANPTNEQVRQHLGGGSQSHISPVMRAFRGRRREQRAEQVLALPPELLTGQLGLLWQVAVKQADADTLAPARSKDDTETLAADRTVQFDGIWYMACRGDYVIFLDGSSGMQL